LSNSSAAKESITVGSAPDVNIITPLNNSRFVDGQTISLFGNASDSIDGNLDSSLHWTVVLHHNTHTHPYINDLPGANQSFFTSPTVETDPNIWYEIDLTANNSFGLSKTKRIDIFPLWVNLTFTTNPVGLQIVLNGQPVATPYVKQSVIGVQQ